ncbi:MAG: hypothetical protein ACE5QV_07930 [Fidelibacterota bacterium]
MPRNIILIISLITAISLNYSYPGVKIAFLPFKNKSDFKNGWFISEEIPRYLSGEIEKEGIFTVFNFDSLLKVLDKEGVDWESITDFSILRRICELTGSDRLILGKIIEFDISRYYVGDITFGGVQYYRAKVIVEFSLFDPGVENLTAVEHAAGIVSQRSIGITMFGKLKKQVSLYKLLDTLQFGSEEFRKTIIGSAMDILSLDFIKKLKKHIDK